MQPSEHHGSSPHLRAADLPSGEKCLKSTIVKQFTSLRKFDLKFDSISIGVTLRGSREHRYESYIHAGKHATRNRA